MLSSKSKLSYPILVISFIVTGLLALYFKPVPYYPSIEFTSANNVQIKHLFKAAINKEACKLSLASLDEDLFATCPSCRITKQACLSQLSTEQQVLLSEAPAPFPTIRLHDGVASYHAADQRLAISACLYAQAHSTNFGHQLECTPSLMPRPITPAMDDNFWQDMLEMDLMFVVAAIASWFICYLIIRYENLHAHFSHDHTDAGPQKFHSLPTPRVGGIALLAALLAAAAVETIFHSISPPGSNSFSYFIIASLPVFFGGIIEDVTKNVGVAQRLLFSMLSASIAIWLLGAVINSVDIASIDHALLWLPFAIALTIFAISGACNAVNIIDGYNGLASGYAAIAVAVIAYIAFLVNDHLVAIISFATLGSLLGFLRWNWPHGKIFMGDGGAYLLGFTLAELAVLLIYRNPSVSPWAAFSLLAYPVFETVFSMFRRKFIHKAKTGQPDARHLHQLIFIKLLQGHLPIKSGQLTLTNSRVAPFIWLPTGLNAILVACFWNNTSILLPLSIIGCALYVLVYFKLVSLPDF